MITYRVELFDFINENLIYNITDLVSLEMKIASELDESLDDSVVLLPLCTLSNSPFKYNKQIPINSKMIITVDGVKYKRLVLKDTTKRISNGLDIWSHQLTLIEPTKILEKRPIPDQTVTQPQGVQLFWESDTNIDPDTKNQFFEAVIISGAVPTTIAVVQTNPPTDPIELELNIMKADNTTFGILASYDFFATPKLITTDRSILATLRVFFNGIEDESLAKEIIIEIGLINSIHTVGDIGFDFTTITDDVTVLFQVLLDDPDDTIYLRSLDTHIYANQDVTVPIKSYAEVIDKMLFNMNAVDFNILTFQEFRLSDTSRAWLNKIPSVESNFNAKTVWDALKDIGDDVNAIPKIGDSDFGVIDFIRVDEYNRVLFNGIANDTEILNIAAQDNTSALEINSSGVVESLDAFNSFTFPSLGRWINVRAKTDGPGKINQTTAAIVVPKSKPFYRIKKVLVTGYPVNYDGGTGTYPASNVYDITDHILEKNRYNGTSDEASDNKTDRLANVITQGNSLTYTQDDTFITGFDHVSEKKDFLGFIPQPGIAIIECILGAAQRLDEAVTVDQVNSGLTATQLTPDSDLKNILFQLEYVPTTDVKARIYKTNAREFATDSILYSNDSDRVVDGNRLARRAKMLVNKLGKVTKQVSGRVSSIGLVPKEGNITSDNEVVTNVSMNLGNSSIYYSATLSEDWTAISEQIGVDSAYREFIVPVDNTLNRTLTYRDFLVVSRNAELVESDASPLDSGFYKFLLYNFFDSPDDEYGPPTYSEFHARFNKAVPSDPSWNDPDAFDTKLIVPIHTTHHSTTLQFNMNMLNNISTYPSKDSSVVLTEEGEEQFYQSEAPYTNDFGEIQSARISTFVRGESEASEIDASNYPIDPEDAFINKGPRLAKIDLNIDKDGREVLNYTQEIAFFAGLSDEGIEDFRIYPGFVKFCGNNVKNDDKDILNVVPVLLKDGYFPPSSDININLSKIKEISFSTGKSSVEVTGGALTGQGKITKSWAVKFNLVLKITPSQEDFNGYALMEKNSGELILAVPLPSVVGDEFNEFPDTIYVAQRNDKGLDFKPFT
jgi:hypothetical protein